MVTCSTLSICFKVLKHFFGKLDWPLTWDCIFYYRKPVRFQNAMTSYNTFPKPVLRNEFWLTKIFAFIDQPNTSVLHSCVTANFLMIILLGMAGNRQLSLDWFRNKNAWWKTNVQEVTICLWVPPVSKSNLFQTA